LGEAGVDGCRGGAVWQGPVRAVVVASVAEAVQEGLQVGEGGRLVGLGARPVLDRLLEAFDCAAGGGVVAGGVVLLDVQAA